MVDPFLVKVGERETIRLFKLDLEGADLQTFLDQSAEDGGERGPLKVALGAETLDGTHVETFAHNDLAGLGLSGYLEEGQGIDSDHLDSAALDAETGHFVLIHAGAFRGQAQVLIPKPPLRLIGAYQIAPATPPIDMEPIEPVNTDRDVDAAPVTAPASHDGLIVVSILAVLLVVVLVALLGWL